MGSQYKFDRLMETQLWTFVFLIESSSTTAGLLFLLLGEEGGKRKSFRGWRMMTVSGMAEQKRRTLHGVFPLPPKRLKTAPGGAPGASSVSPKERKDKIGERVAALQQLVSPFGKSDTASVLTEATAYIKFLHEQLQVLSSPYLHSSPNGRLLDGDERYSLRNRGLCLMPVSATVMIAKSNGADIWAPVTK